MILGIDTSCYTTSLVLVDLGGRIIFEYNQLLKVKKGERGLRQSEGFYQHMYALNEAIKALKAKCPLKSIQAIAVSSKPRPTEASYMPVFHAGLLTAENLAHALDIPLYEFSHQEGHLMAVMSTAKPPVFPENFYAIQISGGTTEWLKVNSFFDQCQIDILGGSKDIHLGQLVDRIGVLMDLQFPCGLAMDQLAQKSEERQKIKVKITADQFFNFSGLENQYQKLLKEKSKEDLAKHLFNTISYCLKLWIDKLPEGSSVIIAGGVASNSHIQKTLSRDIKNKKIIFGNPQYSRDNALGTALLGLNRFKRGEICA